MCQKRITKQDEMFLELLHTELSKIAAEQGRSVMEIVTALEMRLSELKEELKNLSE